MFGLEERVYLPTGILIFFALKHKYTKIKS